MFTTIVNRSAEKGCKMVKPADGLVSYEAIGGLLHQTAKIKAIKFKGSDEGMEEYYTGRTLDPVVDRDITGNIVSIELDDSLPDGRIELIHK